VEELINLSTEGNMLSYGSIYQNKSLKKKFSFEDFQLRHTSTKALNKILLSRIKNSIR